MYNAASQGLASIPGPAIVYNSKAEKSLFETVTKRPNGRFSLKAPDMVSYKGPVCVFCSQIPRAKLEAVRTFSLYLDGWKTTFTWTSFIGK